MEWFVGKARTAAGYRKKILSKQERSRDTTVIGKMFFFSYDPKWKDILPIYDRYPLVFPIESYSDGFLGINLHYLPIPIRTAMLAQLSKLASNKTLTPNTRLRISYDILQSARSLRNMAKPCYHRYLYSHVRSKFIEITPDEWDMAAQLPIELFKEKR